MQLAHQVHAEPVRWRRKYGLYTHGPHRDPWIVFRHDPVAWPVQSKAFMRRDAVECRGLLHCRSICYKAQWYGTQIVEGALGQW